MDPRVAAVARQVRPLSPETRIGLVADVLRMSPYRALPVVDGDPEIGGARLVGMAREADVLGALLGATDVAGRARVREMPVRAVMQAPTYWATPGMRASEAAHLFHTSGADALPVIDAHGTFLGLVAQSDLVQDLVRPFRPPAVGGMATPLGVYLTTGRVSGGAGTLALILTGLVMFAIHLLAQGVGWAGKEWLLVAFGASPVRGVVSPALREALAAVLPHGLQFALFLLMLRFSPVAGYHAAEHQVVHALERAEPLLVETVRAMPRVHPRCGTNLVAGVLILSLGSIALDPFLGWWSLGVAGVAALAYWRTLGAWLQQHLTTRPATDHQIRSGIEAARELLDRHSRAPYEGVRATARVWRMGFLQILSGFACGYGLLVLILELSPGLRALVQPWLGDVLPLSS